MTENSSASQLRPGLWETVNERYPGSMISNSDAVPLALLEKPLSECRLSFVSTSGVQPKTSLPFDTVHPVGDYTFRRVPSVYVHWLQHGSRASAKYVSQKFSGSDRGRKTGCGDCCPGLTDLSSIHRVGPTRNRTIRNPDGFTHGRTRCDTARQATACDVFTVHDGALVWRSESPSVAASSFASVVSMPS